MTAHPHICLPSYLRPMERATEAATATRYLSSIPSDSLLFRRRCAIVRSTYRFIRQELGSCPAQLPAHTTICSIKIANIVCGHLPSNFVLIESIRLGYTPFGHRILLAATGFFTTLHSCSTNTCHKCLPFGQIFPSMDHCNPANKPNLGLALAIDHRLLAVLGCYVAWFHPAIIVLCRRRSQLMRRAACFEGVFVIGLQALHHVFLPW